jgi:[histone H3]-lysine36 N-dimethyltransferase SETMAR
MLELFFDYRGIVHFEFIPEGRTVNKELYVNVLKRLRNAIRRKRPDLWATQDWMLLHDNAPAHRSVIVQQYLAKHSVTVLPQPPYSPDLAPCDFSLFPRMKDALKGRRFSSANDVKAAATEALKDVSRNGFLETFQKLYERWQKCIIAQGEYFEGNVV